jgi:hypothetical protein
MTMLDRPRFKPGTLGIVAALFTLSTRTHALQRQSALPEWSLSSAPVVSIGGDGTPNAEFLRIRAVFRLQTGLIVVVNGGTNEIRVFDARADLVRTFGRTGSGPGEFRFISWAGRSGDTAFVFDNGARRISTVRLGREPQLLGTLPVVAKGGQGLFGVNGRLLDARWLVTTWLSPGFEGPPGVHRLPGSAGLIAADATGDAKWLGDYASGAVFVHNPTGDIKQAAVGAIAFSPWFFAVASGPYVWLGESDGDSLVRFDSRDGKRSTLHLPLPRTVPSPSLVAAARARELSSVRDPRSRAFTEAKYSSTYVPRTLPYFESLVPGPEEELWVQRYAGVPTDSTRYLVIGSDLRPRAWVSVPRGVRVSEVGLDYLLGVHEDDDGVESVRLYRLLRQR